MAKTVTLWHWPWWQPFNSSCFETLSFFLFLPFFFLLRRKVVGPLPPGALHPRCRQPCCTPSFPTGLVKTESESLDQSRLTYGDHLENRCFLVALCHLLSSFRLLPLAWLSEMTILSNVRKPDNFESYNSLKLSYIQISEVFEFRWMWIFSWIKLSWNPLLNETKVNDSIDSSNVCCPYI